MTDRDFLQEVAARHQEIVDLRRFFHRHPETAREEFGTAKRIEEELDKAGIPHRRVGETGVYGELTGGQPQESGSKGRKIILRADIDALPIQESHESPYMSVIPGKMHACGHDAHTAALLGAARFLSAHREEFSGTVGFAFQQAEEIGYGGRLFVESGLLADADRSFGLHTAPDLDAGSVAITDGANNASVDWFRITLKGHPAHVAMPEQGADALYMASQLVVALQALITRRTSPMEPLLIGVGKLTAGDAYNIVARQAELEGTVRAFSPDVRAAVKSQVEALAKNTAASFGGQATVEWKDFTAPLINDSRAAAEVRQTATRLFGPDKVIANRRPLLTGDDFAEFIRLVPGAYAYLGTAAPDRPETRVSYHDSQFDIDEKSLLVAVALYAQYALDFLKGAV